MTITRTNRKAGPFAGNGVTATFAFEFKVFAAADVLVILADEDGNESTGTLGSTHTVTLSGDGGSVVMMAAPAVGQTLTLSSRVSELQPVQLTNLGGFFPKVIEGALDRLTVLIQQVAERADRSLKTSISTPDGVSLSLPGPSAGMVIGWNAAGDALENQPPVSPIIVPDESTAALRLDLASQLAGKGGALVGYSGRTVFDKLAETVSPLDKGAKGDGVTDDTAAVQAAFADGRPVDLLGKTYAMKGSVVLSGMAIFRSATLKFTSNVTTALELKPGADFVGDLTIDVSAVTCTNGVLIDGQWQSTHANAQKGSGVINVKGKDHSASTNGVMMRATTAGAANKAWIHYCDFSGRVVVENFSYGLSMQASQASLTLSYINANRINVTAVGCKYSINLTAPSGEISANEIGHVVQYGWVAGDAPVYAINLSGPSVAGNRLQGYGYDWDHTAVTGPVIIFDTGTHDNAIESSSFGWEVRDWGNRNRYTSRQSPQSGSLWLSPHGRNLLGDQDNVLAAWSPSIGTLTAAATTSGTATCNLASGAITDVMKENSAYATVAFSDGTGVASYTLEFRSTTVTISNMGAVGVYFEPGYLPNGVKVQIDTGAGYVTRADFSDISNPEVIARLDTVSGSDLYNGVLGVKVTIYASDTRTVRVRQVFANGTGPSTFTSRGGDRMNGDLHFRAGIGPCLVDTVTGNLYRMQVTNGAVVLVASPATQMTHF